MSHPVFILVNLNPDFAQKIILDCQGQTTNLLVESGRAALDLLEQTPVDLILATLPVPDMSIEEFSRRTRETQPCTVIALLTETVDLGILSTVTNQGTLRGLFLPPWTPEAVFRKCIDIVDEEKTKAGIMAADQIMLSNQDLEREVRLRLTIQDLLQTEKDLLSTTLMSIGEGVIVTDDQECIILINKAAELITGYNALEAVQSPLHSIFRLSDSATLKPFDNEIEALFEIDHAEKAGKNVHHPTLQTKNGRRILIACNITPRSSEHDHTGGYVIIFQDITEKQKNEAQTALSQKMEAIGQLAAGIAHEINTPIQYIGDNLRFLSKAFSRYSETLDAYQLLAAEHVGKVVTQENVSRLEELGRNNKIPRYIQEIPTAIGEALDGIERVRKIVLAMREFSHPSEREKKLADINHGIETTVTISRNEWKYCADVELNLDHELPLIICQIDEINQVILNMIVNAAQAIQEKFPVGSGLKGKITISTFQRDSNISITVEDCGAGIPAEIQDRIFDPFFTTKGIGRGTGQGLSVAQNIIVKKHRGAISVDSKVGEGTKFTISLPIDNEEDGGNGNK